MPRRFLKSDHRETLSNFPGIIDDHDVIIHFLLTPDDLVLVNGFGNRLGSRLRLLLSWLSFMAQ